ncbi:hypothetical protein Dimus_028299 [Dionaea muscipula]
MVWRLIWSLHAKDSFLHLLFGHRWKLLDFAELKQNSISFFDHENQESAVSRWSRAKSNAAKVGKGLSKCDKARKLALQHWLEAVKIQQLKYEVGLYRTSKHCVC